MRTWAAWWATAGPLLGGRADAQAAHRAIQNDGFLTREKVEARLGLKAAMVQRPIKHGALVAHEDKVGSHTRQTFWAADVDALALARGYGPGTDENEVEAVARLNAEGWLTRAQAMAALGIGTT